MLPRERRQERLSLAYVRAVAAAAGYGCTEPEEDFGFDALVSHVAQLHGKYADTGHALNIQAKCDSNARIDELCIVHDLKVANYNHLARTDLGTPAILVLYCVPGDAKAWLSASEEYIVLRKSAYWLNLRGMPVSRNCYTKRIRIPRAQVFDANALAQLMAKTRVGDPL